MRKQTRCVTFTLAENCRAAAVGWAAVKQCPTRRRRVAFTLAEVLITLGIIGIVAAMTLPTLVAKYQKDVTITKLKKIYTVMNQAIKLSEVDNGVFSSWGITSDTNPKEYVEKYWLPYFEGAELCETYSDCGYEKIRPWTKPDKTNVSQEDVTGTQYRHAIKLKDGTVISFRIPPVTGSQVNNDAKINIDINGPQKPNVSGIDYFWLIPTDKGVVFYGQDKDYEEIQNSCTKTSTNSLWGSYCFAKIVHDGWKIKDDYPW